MTITVTDLTDTDYNFSSCYEDNQHQEFFKVRLIAQNKACKDAQNIIDLTTEDIKQLRNNCKRLIEILDLTIQIND